MRLHQIKVELAGVRPPVWRRVLLSPEITLGKLHRVLQAVMGWEDSHAHAFVQDGRTYSDPRFELDGNVLDERSVSLGEILAEPGSRLIYLYDFGDDWKHELLCEGFVGSDVEGPYAICTDGARACPPEDCGGPYAYNDLLGVLKNPKHKDYVEMRAWVGADFDPEAFDPKAITKRLSAILRKSRK
jgi:hypothetical protein